MSFTSIRFFEQTFADPCRQAVFVDSWSQGYHGLPLTVEESWCRLKAKRCEQPVDLVER